MNSHQKLSINKLVCIVISMLLSICSTLGYSTSLKYTNNCPWPVTFALFYCNKDGCGDKCSKGIAYGIKHLDLKQKKTLSSQKESDDDDIIDQGKYYCFEDSNGESMQIHDYTDSSKGYHESDAIGFEAKDHVYACGEDERHDKMETQFVSIGLGQFNVLEDGVITDSYPEGQIAKVGGSELQSFSLDFPVFGEHCQFYQSDLSNGKEGFSCTGPVDVGVFRKIKIKSKSGEPLKVAYVLLCSNSTGTAQPCPWVQPGSFSSMQSLNIFG